MQLMIQWFVVIFVIAGFTRVSYLDNQFPNIKISHPFFSCHVDRRTYFLDFFKIVETQNCHIYDAYIDN